LLDERFLSSRTPPPHRPNPKNWWIEWVETASQVFSSNIINAKQHGTVKMVTRMNFILIF